MFLSQTVSNGGVHVSKKDLLPNCVCVSACVRACVRARACVYACVRARVCVCVFTRWVTNVRVSDADRNCQVSS